MAQYQQVEYLIDRQGHVVERVINGQGKSCVELTAELEAALGEVEKREFLPAYAQDTPLVTEETVLPIRQQQG